MTARRSFLVLTCVFCASSFLPSGVLAKTALLSTTGSTTHSEEEAKGCSCERCDARLRRPHQFHGDHPERIVTPARKDRDENNVLQCVATMTHGQTSVAKDSAECDGFCDASCSPVVPRSSPVKRQSNNVTTWIACEDKNAPGDTEEGHHLTSSAVAPAKKKLDMLQLNTLRSLAKECPAPQPCDCWCHCPEIDFGAPMPPGIPPVPAVNPFQPPPPIPKPPPPPFGGGPPPAAGVPFNPAVPAASSFLQTGKGAKAKQPCAGPECRGPLGCPESAPCNCYCQCRAPVPPKFLLQLNSGDKSKKAAEMMIRTAARH